MSKTQPRRGISWTGSLVVLATLVGVPMAAIWFVPWGSFSEKKAGPLTHKVGKGLFTHTVTEHGELESSSNVEVRCEIQSRGGSSGVAILEIVPEGTYVETDDFLVRFDASNLQNELNQQQIVVNASNALVITSENTFETAKIAEKEYLEGTFVQERTTIEGEIFIAEENLRRASDYATYSEKLAAKGFITELQLDADRFAVEKARKELQIAQTKLDVLQRFTKEKMLGTLRSDVKIAEAKLMSDRETLKLDQDKLQLIKDQIAKCVVKAPSPGQVVYAKEDGGRNGSDFIVGEGVIVRERQVVIRLPDPKRMQVKAKINEARVDRLRPGQFAVVKLDAMPDKELEGVVRKVDEYPLSANWFSSSVKEYGAYIDLTQSGISVRPGMTAQVKIYVEQLPDVVQVPVQAVFERGGSHFCLVRGATGALEARTVKIGSTNDSFLVIHEGLAVGDDILMEPMGYLDQVKLPAEAMLAAGEKVRELPKLAEQQPVKPRVASETTAAGGEQAGGPGGRRRGGGGAGTPDIASMDPAMVVDMMLPQMDKDKDGRLTKEEMPAQGRANFEQTDANKDGFVDRDEMIAGMKKLQERAAAAAKNKAAAGLPADGPAAQGGQSGS